MDLVVGCREKNLAKCLRKAVEEQGHAGMSNGIGIFVYAIPWHIASVRTSDAHIAHLTQSKFVGISCD